MAFIFSEVPRGGGEPSQVHRQPDREEPFNRLDLQVSRREDQLRRHQSRSSR